MAKAKDFVTLGKLFMSTRGYNVNNRLVLVIHLLEKIILPELRH